MQEFSVWYCFIEYFVWPIFFHDPFHRFPLNRIMPSFRNWNLARKIFWVRSYVHLSIEFLAAKRTFWRRELLAISLNDLLLSNSRTLELSTSVEGANCISSNPYVGTSDCIGGGVSERCNLIRGLFELSRIHESRQFVADLLCFLYVENGQYSF